MNRKKYLYSSGEFAKFTGINKRTLHYYNDIGLFSPEVIGENGYHYYTCFQFAQLELILTLRKIGLSIDEIRTYVTKPSDASFTQMMQQKKKLIDESISQLLSAQAFLEQKAERLRLGMHSKDGTIEICDLPERKIILSSPISGKYDEADFSIAAEFSLRLKKLFHLYDNFGSCIPIDSIYQNDFYSYEAFFAYCPPAFDTYDVILPAGKYLRAFCIGEWNKLPDIYRTILSYAAEHNLRLTGHAYEEGLNEMSISDRSDYITMITIKCDNLS